MKAPLPVALAVTAVALVAAVPAAAQDPAPTPTPPPEATPSPTPTPTPTPTPVAGELAIAVQAPYHDGRTRVALRGDRVQVTGTLTPFVAGQQARVRVRHGSRRVLTRTVRIRRQPDGSGAFSVRLRLRRPGTMTIQAAHAATPELAAASTDRVRVLVLRPNLDLGARGPLVRLLQRGLRGMRYETGAAGRYDDATARGVMAWRRVNGRARVFSADADVIRRVLAGRGGWKVRHPRAGRHVEADLSLAALALIDKGRVQHVYYTSPGKPSTPTILGAYRFYLKTPGTNALGMVDSSYFIRGYAIHGYHDVPTYNASHGCLRVPIANARAIYDWVRIGDRIFVEP